MSRDDPVARAGDELRPTTGWELQGVHLRRGQNEVFKALNLCLHEARIGLIGPNGAGKSSLLRLLSGLDTPQAGAIAWRGQQLHNGVREHGPSRHVGLMFQNPDDQIIFPTVQEELTLSWQCAHAGDRKAARAAVQEFLTTRGLADWQTRAVGTLSQGQRQWLCWLAMLLAEPQVLLLDEPYASLDLPGQMRLAVDVERCSQQVIVSTHVLEHVRHFERVLWLDHGEIRADGPGNEVCTAYEAAARAQFAQTG